MNIISKLIFSFVIAALTPVKSYAEQQELADSLLWEVSGNGLAKSSYLTGTLHIMCKEDFAILPKVKRAIKSSDQLYMEVDLSDPKVMAEGQKMALSDTLLTDTLTTEQQNTLNQVLQDSMGMSIEQVNSFSMNALFSMMLIKTVECPSIKILDLEISKLAASEGKTIEGLETIHAQMEFMDKAFSDEYILSYFEQMDEYKGVFADMVEAFKAEDINELMEMLEDPRFYNADVEHWLLTVRNKNWVEIMPEIMHQNSTVFAVGAGHLGGEMGVIHLLERAGYDVKPVMN